ncbi:unnamed protein product [Gongylonema pulchrum]|uniref:Uncharacterized protein n=1 Tax=Gongylonema pulchrum TaxID=637853 RepID=A0A183EJU6_9BILA|nr:unnamed protein product [Gongylonema pulchrum]
MLHAMERFHIFTLCVDTSCCRDSRIRPPQSAALELFCVLYRLLKEALLVLRNRPESVCLADSAMNRRSDESGVGQFSKPDFNSTALDERQYLEDRAVEALHQHALNLSPIPKRGARLLDISYNQQHQQQQQLHTSKKCNRLDNSQVTSS